jgi:hypothetical protein
MMLEKIYLFFSLSRRKDKKAMKKVGAAKARVGARCDEAD